jgi:hypothetical protein
MPYLSILIMAGCAIFFHRAADFEGESGLLWSILSLLISGAILFFFHWGWMACLLGQLSLFVGITVVRMIRKS